MTSHFVPNFSVFDPPSPAYSSTVSDSFSSMSPSSSASNVDNHHHTFDASKEFPFEYGIRQGTNPNLNQSSGGWSPEEESISGLSSHGQQASKHPPLQQYHFLPQQLQQKQYISQSDIQTEPNVFSIQHHFQPFQTQHGQAQQLQSTPAEPSKPTAPQGPNASKKSVPKNKKRTGGDDGGAQKRAIHNATERARRETLNGRFLNLAAAIPATSRVSRPSKPLIVKSALSFVEEALRLESIYREQIQGLASENDRLLKMLNAERKKLGIEEIISTTKKDLLLPTPLTEMKLADHSGQGDEVENENGSETGYGGSQDDLAGSNPSIEGTESDSGSYRHLDEFNGFTMPAFFSQVGTQAPINQCSSSTSSPFSAPVDPLNLQETTQTYFPNFNDGRRHSVSGFSAGYPQNF